jgi:phytoene dehydrogenase-like protein
MLTATVIGSGPDGLSAAIVLGAAGLDSTVFERNAQIGGACSSAETTLANFRQDLGSFVYPMGIASPFFRSLPINIPWIEPTALCAHPFDDGTAVMLEDSIEATVGTLDACDRGKYRSLMAPRASTIVASVSEHSPLRQRTNTRFAYAIFATSMKASTPQYTVAPLRKGLVPKTPRQNRPCADRREGRARPNLLTY